MSFLYPSFLWALGVLAIPVIVHLFNFRRTKRVYFSDTRFLKEVKESSSAKRNLKHYLILASRILFLLFLVLAFAQPFIPAEHQFTQRDVVVYLDNSQSMSARTEDQTRALDVGIQMVQEMVDVFPPDTRYKLITNDFAPFSNVYKTKTEIIDLLSQIRLTSVSRTMEELVARIKGGSTSMQEIFWISDFQSSTLGSIPQSLDSSWRIHMLPISLAKAGNIFVDTVYLDNPFAAGGEHNVMRISLRNDGDKALENISVKLAIKGIQSGTAITSIPAKGISDLNFDLATGLSGLNEAQITFNDFPITFDNTFNLALNFTSKINVIEIHDGHARTYIARVYGNTSVFDYQRFAVQNFNYAMLNTADLVVLNGISVDLALSKAIQDFALQGGSVLVIPSATPNVEQLRNLIGLKSLSLDEHAKPQVLASPDFNDPFFENVFEEKSNTIAMPKGSSFLSWGKEGHALLSFKHDRPFLGRVGNHRFYLMANPLQESYTDFYHHALFVPVMYRLAAGSKRNVLKLYYTLSQNLVQVEGGEITGNLPVKLLGKEEVIPGQRKVGNQIQLDIPKFMLQEGFYYVVLQHDTLGLLAFNAQKEESLLGQIAMNELEAKLAMGDRLSIFKTDSASTFSNEIKERYLGTPLWKYALALGLLFLLVEILLIRFLK
jgi:hypothetical protein